MFNTLRYVKKLEAAGITREHTEAHVQILADIIEDNLFTKRDGKDLEHRLSVRLISAMVVVATISTSILAFLMNAKD